MILRMSAIFVRTLRDDPADADVPSHRLLVRAGYVRRVGPGIYSWLPLGLMVLRRVEEIVRSEMLSIGAQEVLLPALIPREYFDRSGRWKEYGESLFRLADRRGGDYLLGPTHEELFTLMVKGEYSSYKDFPLSLFQIQTKYRDEPRPRAGVVRGREFIMKDSYSFDISDDGLAASYRAHRDAYERMFTRMGLTYRIVSALSGAMGGSASEEFLAPTPSGEDTFVQCTNCDYAANTEAVEMAAGAGGVAGGSSPEAEVVDTPDTPTIDSLVERLNTLRLGRSWSAADTLKNVVLRVVDPGVSQQSLVVVGVPGDREVDVKRVEAQLYPATVEPATAEDFARYPALVKGYIGPRRLAEAGIRYLVDPAVSPGSAWVTGADRLGFHEVNVVRGRDFEPEGEIGAVEIEEGDPCPRCGSALTVARGIEMGHVFQLGRKFADAYELDVAGPDGSPVRVTMGSYGVGVSRAVAAIAEQTLDDLGLCWPASVAPAAVHIVIAGKDAAIEEAAATLAASLSAAGVSVLVDDRPAVSAGVKFRDAELLGMPTIVTVGRKLAEGLVEVRDRRSGERVDVAVGDAPEVLASRR